MAHALPLHHVHGVINGLYFAHYIGDTVHLMPKFSPAAMWKELQVHAPEVLQLGMAVNGELRSFRTTSSITCAVASDSCCH